MDQRFVRQRSVLHFADHHGPIHVFGVEDDADDHHRPAAANDDEDYAGNHGWAVHDLSHFERLGSVYSYEQLGRNRATVVAESHASVARGGSESGAREKRKNQKEVRHLW